MAISIDYSTSPYTISVPQADLTLISGTLYELDTNQLRLDLKALEAAQQGIVFGDTHRHNSEYTVAGVTYARSFELLNSTVLPGLVDEYQIQFTPDAQYSVRLAGSNNNVFDVESGILVQNQVQIIAQNSAGLINAGVAIDTVIDGTVDVLELYRILLAYVGGITEIIDNGDGTATVRFKAQDGAKNRIDAALDASERTSVTLDGSE